jgi:hypothetical protein
MAFRELKGTGGGNWFKWPTKAYGTKFIGQFKALATGEYQGKVTFHAIFTDAQGKQVKVNTPTILRDKLTEAESGMNLEIEYTADMAGKGGKTGAKDFRVTVLGDVVPEQPQQQAAPQAQAPQETEAEKQAKAFAAFLAQQKQAEVPQASPYDALVAKLKEKDPKGAPALLGALEQIYKDADARVKALTDHLKAQGVAV